MSERRTQPRREVCLDVELAGATANGRARITDISEGGCYVDSTGDACIGELVQCKVQLPTHEWLELRGEVAYHFSRLGFGVRFVDLGGEQIQKLRWLLHYLKEPRHGGIARMVA